jgi:hypothetical protein
VWSNAKVEYEIITRRKNVPCHSAPVRAFHSFGDWLVSIGMLWAGKDRGLLVSQEGRYEFNINFEPQEYL